MKQELMSRPGTSGALDRRHFLTSRCSTHMPSPTRSSLLHPVSAITRSQRKEPTNKEVEHGSFTPLVFSTTRGMGRLASIFYSRLALLLVEKRHQPCATTMGWLRCLLSFSLLRSSILCIRGTRSNRNYIPRLAASFDLAVGESCVAV